MKGNVASQRYSQVFKIKQINKCVDQCRFKAKGKDFSLCFVNPFISKRIQR